jgi:hypothetical protein
VAAVGVLALPVASDDVEVELAVGVEVLAEPCGACDCVFEPPPHPASIASSMIAIASDAMSLCDGLCVFFILYISCIGLGHQEAHVMRCVDGLLAQSGGVKVLRG